MIDIQKSVLFYAIVFLLKIEAQQKEVRSYSTPSYSLNMSSKFSDSCSLNTAQALNNKLFNLGAGTNLGGLQWIQFDLNSEKTITEIRFSPLWGCGWGPNYINGKLLEYSNDALNWTIFTTISGAVDGSYSSYTMNITARFWRVSSTTDFVGLGEFILYEVKVVGFISGSNCHVGKPSDCNSSDCITKCEF